MARIGFEKIEIFSGQLLNFLRKTFESLPELRRRSVHLEIPQFTLSFRRIRFVPQKVEPAGSGIALDLSIPVLPISFGDPLPEPHEIFWRQSFNFRLNYFYPCHQSLLPQAAAVLANYTSRFGPHQLFERTGCFVPTTGYYAVPP
jgi:hypothetical protein